MTCFKRESILRAEGFSDHELMREVAAGYERIGALQGRFAGVGGSQASLASLAKAAAIQSSLVEAPHHDARDLQDEAASLRFIFHANSVPWPAVGFPNSSE